MYTDFANIYDFLMADVPYQELVQNYIKMFNLYGKPKSILDLGCGTGTITKMLSQKGYNTMGLDISIDMLVLAKEKDKKSLYINQDMTRFELYQNVDAIISSLDCVNYITDKRDLKRMLGLVNKNLNNEGLFIFDINTPYKLKNIMCKNTFVYEQDNIFYTWETKNYGNICDFHLNFFVGIDGLYQRVIEKQSQRIWKIDELSELISLAGLDLVALYDGFGMDKAHSKSERVTFVCKKKQLL